MSLKKLKEKILSHPKYLFPILGLDTRPHQVEWLNHVMKHRFAQIIAPVSHGKSFTIACVYSLWRILRNNNIRIGLISHSSGQATGSIMFIREHLEENELLKDIFGDLRPPRGQLKKWGNTALQVTRTRISRDPTILSFGMSGSIYGRRFDLIICDDMLDPEEQAMSEDQRQKAKDFFNNTLFNRIDVGGEIKIIGTPAHFDDLVMEIHNKKKGETEFRSVKYSAIKKDGTPLDPVNIPMEELMKYKRSVGPVGWTYKYMCDPIDFGTAMFDFETIKAKMWDFKYRFAKSRADIPEGMDVYMGVDLAIGGGNDSSYFVVFTMAIDSEGNRIVLDIYRDRLPFPRQKDIIISKYNTFQPRVLTVENNAYQMAMVQDLEGSGIPVYGSHTGAGKMDPINGVASLALIIDNGQLKMPIIGTQEKVMCEQFTNELIQFPKGKTSDIIMAWYLCEEGRRRFASGPSKPNFSFFRPRARQRGQRSWDRR